MGDIALDHIIMQMSLIFEIRLEKILAMIESVTNFKIKEQLWSNETFYKYGGFLLNNSSMHINKNRFYA